MRLLPQRFVRQWKTTTEVFREFRPALEGQGPGVLAAICLTVVSVLVFLFRPWPIKFLLDDVLLPAREAGATFDVPRTLVLVLCGAVLLTSAFAGQLEVWKAVTSARVTRRVVVRVRRRLFLHLHRLALPFHLGARAGDLVVRLMGDVNMLRDLLFGAWLSILERIGLAVGSVVLMFLLDPLMAFLAVLPLPLLGLGLRRSGKRLHQITRKQRKKEGDAASFAAESLRQILVVKAYTREESAGREFAHKNRSGERAGGKAARVAASMTRLAEIMTGAGLAVVLWVGVDRVVGGSLTAGDLILFVTYTRALYRPLRGLSREAARFAKAAACGQRVLEILKRPVEAGDVGETAPAFLGEIEVKNLHYGWRSTKSVLNGVSFKLPPGALAVVQGPNGAGKSTLLSLLLRLVEPSRGEVLVDGHTVTNYSLASYRAQLAFVPQDLLLFGATVRENVLYGKPEASDEEVVAACQRAHVHEFVDGLPEGYDTALQEDGSGLSGGQKRRIMLARAAVRDARFLVMDEPLQGLDPKTRRDVAGSLRSIAQGRTTLVVSHESLDELEPDVVINLDQGRAQITFRNAEVSP